MVKTESTIDPKDEVLSEFFILPYREMKIGIYMQKIDGVKRAIRVDYAGPFEKEIKERIEELVVGTEWEGRQIFCYK